MAINQHRACAAGATIAHLLGSREIESVPERVEQRDTGLDIQLPLLAIDPEGERRLTGAEHLRVLGKSRRHAVGRKKARGHRCDPESFEESTAGKAVWLMVCRVGHGHLSYE